MLNPFQTLLVNRFVFIDCENVNAKETFDFVKEHNFLNLQTQIVCLIGADKNQNNWYNDFKKNLTNLAVNVTPIRVSKSGEQFLDKVLLTYVGFAIGQNSFAEIIIIARDKGYKNIAEHFENIGVKITHRNLPKTNAVKEPQSTKNLPQPKSEKKAKRGQPVKLEEAFKKITKLERNQRPKKKKGIRNYINFNFISSDLDSDTDKLIKKLKTEKFIEINDTKITWKK